MVESPDSLGKNANKYIFLFLSSWSPFKLSRSEAEELLSRAEPGAFVFSHDMTSELFLSIWYEDTVLFSCRISISQYFWNKDSSNYFNFLFYFLGAINSPSYCHHYS